MSSPVLYIAQLVTGERWAGWVDNVLRRAERCDVLESRQHGKVTGKVKKGAGDEMV